jgi:hypothetical protein
MLYMPNDRSHKPFRQGELSYMQLATVFILHQCMRIQLDAEENREI